MESLARRTFGRMRRWRRRLRGEFFAVWVRLWVGSAGPGILLDGGLRLRHLPHAGWEIGPHAYFGQSVILDIRPKAKFVVGARSKIMHYVVIGAGEGVEIGPDCQIAEFSSIRDADHGVDVGGLISEAPMASRPIRIGANSWIGRGSAVISGAEIGSGVVIGANSVVRTPIGNNSVAVGAPARVVRQRRIPEQERDTGEGQQRNVSPVS